MKLESYLRTRAGWVESALKRFLKRRGLPVIIKDSMNYSVLAGGKRLRPVLTMAAAEVCGLHPKKVLPAACALEMIHTYSLIHDDLPAMDDDSFRRGKPTNHKVFGEAVAILAGDGLLTYAFELLSENSKVPGISSERVTKAVRAVAQGAGPAGMVGGQALEISREPGFQAKTILLEIHKLKTAALITASLEAGAILAGAPAPKHKALKSYGQAIGLSFQITDDLLDRKTDREGLNFPSVYGPEASLERARRCTASAHEALKPFGQKAWMLHELADFIQNRTDDKTLTGA